MRQGTDDMAFQLPGLPNLNVQQSPPFDPVAQRQKQATLAGMLSENALRSQLAPLQVQEAAERAKQANIQTQEAQNTLESQNNLTKMYATGAFDKLFDGEDHSTATNGQTPQGIPDVLPFDPNKMLSMLAKNGVRIQEAAPLVSGFIDRAAKMSDVAKNLGAAAKDQFDTYAKAHESLANNLAPFLKMSVDEAAPALKQWQQELAKNPIPGLDKGDMNYLLTMPLADLPSAITKMGIEAETAKFYKEKAARIKEEQGIIPPGGGMSPDTQQQVNKEVAVSTNPQIQKGKEEVAAAEGAARANIEAQVARGSQAALAGVPTHLVAPATAAAEKAGTKYATLSGQVDNLKSQLKAAKNGDEVASAFAPVAVALGSNAFYGTHRLAPAEVNALGAGLGSVARELNTWFDKHAKGELPPDSLKEFNGLVDRLETGALSEYKNSLKVANSTYGSKFEPVDMKATPTGGKILSPADWMAQQKKK
jgi:hypothetical protein